MSTDAGWRYDNTVPYKPSMGTITDGATGGTTTPVSSEVDDAYQLMLGTLRQWGLEALAPDVLKMLQQGRTVDQIPVLLQQTDSYKQRFAGNQTRIKNGLAALSPAEYLSVEASYRRILESNGMPSGFYDSPGDFAGWIGGDVAPTEIQSRVGLAVSAANRLDDATKAAFRDYYGVGPNDLAAFFLDRERALPQIQKLARAAEIGSASIRSNIGFDRAQSERLAASTIVGENEIDSAIGSVAEAARDVGKLGQLYGDRTYGASTAADEVFFGDVEAKRRRQKLIQQESATFGGSSGVGRSSLTQDTGRY